MKKTKIHRRIKRGITSLIAISACIIVALPCYADNGITIKVTGTDKLDGYEVTGTYYNIGSNEKVQSVIKTDANGKAYFSLPTKEYTNFDYSMLVQGFEIAGTKEVAEIKQVANAEITNDIGWAVALGAFNNESANSEDTAMNYNEIAAEGVAQGDNQKSNETNNENNYENNAVNSPSDTNIVNKKESSVQLVIESTTETSLLREEVTITLSGINGSASFKATLGEKNSTYTVNLPDGAYNVSTSETSNTTEFSSKCNIINGECTIRATLQPISTLRILNGTETETQIKIRSGNKNATVKTSNTVAVEPKRSYIVNILEQPIKYNLMIPTVPNDYIFDFATGELTIDRPDKSTETIEGTEENPFGIAETVDKGYEETQKGSYITFYVVYSVLINTVLVVIRVKCTNKQRSKDSTYTVYK